MKIINETGCYIQGADLENLLYNDVSFPTCIYFEASEGYGKINRLTQYFRIKSEKAIEYLKKSDKVVDFDYLNSMNIDELCELEDSIKREIRDVYDSDDGLTGEDKAAATIGKFKEARKKEYELMQVREMIAFKKGKSKINYPNGVRKPKQAEEDRNVMTIEEYANRMSDKKYLRIFRKNNQGKRP